MNIGMNIEKELEELIDMNKWLGTHLPELPLTLQIKYMDALMDFCDRAKQIYVAAMMCMKEFTESDGEVK